MTPTKNKSEWFTCTSDKPYDRHFYVVTRPDNDPVTFDDYELMRAWWFQQMYKTGYTVTVLDKVQYNTKGKGFK